MEIAKPNLSFDLWREKLIRIYYAIVGLIFVVEVFIFFAFRRHGLAETYSDLNYIICFIIMPTTISLILVIACHRINKMSIKAPIKNYTVLITVSVLAGVIGYIHYGINALLTIFVIPVFLTILFGQKRITATITILNVVLLLLTAAHTMVISPSYAFYLNAVVSLALLLVTYLLSTVLIEYNKASCDYAHESYQKQLSLHEQAQNDSMTGLYNQKTFQSLLKTTMEKTKIHKSPMSLAIIDLDDFKEINDTFGHLEGDQVLLHFTNLIKHQYPDREAYVSRYGGDEFAVIFPRASKELAYLRLEALRQRCRQVPISMIRSGEIRFSAGISHYLEGEMNETLLFRQADSALYQAKENGKGQTVVYAD